jgi:hypothetical protein
MTWSLTRVSTTATEWSCFCVTTSFQTESWFQSVFDTCVQAWDSIPLGTHRLNTRAVARFWRQQFPRRTSFLWVCVSPDRDQVWLMHQHHEFIAQCIELEFESSRVTHITSFPSSSVSSSYKWISLSSIPFSHERWYFVASRAFWRSLPLRHIWTSLPFDPDRTDLVQVLHRERQRRQLPSSDLLLTFRFFSIAPEPPRSHLNKAHNTLSATPHINYEDRLPMGNLFPSLETMPDASEVCGLLSHDDLINRAQRREQLIELLLQSHGGPFSSVNPDLRHELTEQALSQLIYAADQLFFEQSLGPISKQYHYRIQCQVIDAPSESWAAVAEETSSRNAVIVKVNRASFQKVDFTLPKHPVVFDNGICIRHTLEHLIVTVLHELIHVLFYIRTPHDMAHNEKFGCTAYHLLGTDYRMPFFTQLKPNEYQQLVQLQKKA